MSLYRILAAMLTTTVCSGVAAQNCPSLEAIDLGAVGLAPGAPTAFEAVDFDGPGPGSTRLFAMGSFTRAGAASVPGFAMWDGAAWSGVAGAPEGLRTPMCRADKDGHEALHVAGTGTVLHCFDGSGWSEIGLPTYNGNPLTFPLALARFDPDGAGPAPLVLAAALRAGSGTAVYLFDGQQWTQLGGVIPHVQAWPVAGLTAFDPDGDGPLAPELALYIDVWYEQYPKHYVLDAKVHHFAQGSWQLLGSVAGGNNYNGIHAMQVYDADGAGPAPPRLIIAGDFYDVLGIPGTRNIAAWDGHNWSALGDGLSYPPALAIATYDADGAGPGRPVLVVQTQNYPSSSLLAWDGASWGPFPSGAPASAGPALLAYDEGGLGRDSLAVAGFESVGGVPCHNFAIWRGDHWGATAQRPNGVVRALEIFNDGSGRKLFAAGAFDRIGAEPAHSIARWSGSEWQPLVAGIEPTAAIPSPFVNAMAVHHDGSGWAIYVGGLFGSVAGQGVSHIARWDGVHWSRVGGSGFNNEVLTLQSHDPDGAGPLSALLYAGGYFLSVDGRAAHRLAAWNGEEWTEPFGGTDGVVRALRSWDDGSGPALYVGGNPMTPGGQAASPLAKLGASGWLPSPPWPFGFARFDALAVHDDGFGPLLYGGGIITMGSASRASLARLEPTGWTIQRQESYSEQGVCLRSVMEGQERALYLGTTEGLLRLGTGTWRSLWPDFGRRRVWAVTPLFDDGGGPGAFVATGTSENIPSSLGQVQRVRSCPGCYANCDGSSAPPVLNVADFICFQQHFAAGDPWANCDGSVGYPRLNVADFVCFQQRFAAGCP